MDCSVNYFGYALTSIVVIAFALYPSIAPVGLANGSSPLGFVFATMMVAVIGTGAVAAVRRERILPTRAQLSERLILGVLFFLEHVCLLFALSYFRVPVAMSLIYTYPFMIGVAEAVVGRHAIAPYLFLSLSTSLVGICCVLGFSVEQLSGIGILCAMLQAVVAASRILMTARCARGATGLTITTQMFSVAIVLCLVFIPFVPFSLPREFNGWIAIILAGCSSMVGHVCVLWALQRVDPVPFAVMMNLEPVVAALFSAVFAGQILSLPQYLGALMVVASVVLYTSTEEKR